jgi:hypothetical protein
MPGRNSVELQKMIRLPSLLTHPVKVGFGSPQKEGEEIGSFARSICQYI